MKVTALTLDGQNLNDGSKYAVTEHTLEEIWYTLAGKELTTEQTLFGPKTLGQALPEELQFVIQIKLLRNGQNRMDDFRELKRLCGSGRPERSTHTLVITEDEYPEAITQQVTIERVQRVTNREGTCIVHIYCTALDPLKYGAVTRVVNVTGEALPYSVTLTPAADAEVLPVFAINPLTFSGGKYYSQHYFYNQMERELNNIPVCITFDHATQVTAGRSLADGSDICVWVNGRQVDCWVSGANSATCKVWFYLSLPPGHTTTITEAIGSGASAPFDLDVSDMKGAQGDNYCRIGNEFFSYRKKSRTKIRLKSRALPGGSAAAAHSIGDTLTVIPACVRLEISTTAQTQPGTDKTPAIDLSNSDNTKWRWGTTGISAAPAEGYGAGPSRGWLKAQIASGGFYLYRGKESPTGGWNPAAGTDRIAGIAKVIAGMQVDRFDAFVKSVPFRLTYVRGTVASMTDPSFVQGRVSVKEEAGWKDILTFPAASTASAWTAESWFDIAVSDVNEVAVRNVKLAAIQQNYACEARVIQLDFNSNDTVQCYPATPTFTSSTKKVSFTITNSTTGESLRVKSDYIGQSWTVVDCARGRVYAAFEDPPIEELGAEVVPIRSRRWLDENAMFWIHLEPGIGNDLVVSSDDALTMDFREYEQKAYN